MKRSMLISLFSLIIFSFGFKLNLGETDSISKIYLIGSTLIRTTPGSDIRLYDIENPASPRQLSTITIADNHDVAVESHYMYADDGQNLTVYDIADKTKPVPVDTVVGTFDHYLVGMPVDNMPESGFSGCNSCGRQEETVAPTVLDGATSGQGGSLARFAIIDHYLYCVNTYNLTIYDISDPAKPVQSSVTNIGWDIETIFADGDRLFIGGQRGMYIFSITDRTHPTEISQFQHARSCDPVVVDGNRAYVTLRSGSACGSNGDQMDILDITNIENPVLIKTVNLSGPYGLAVRDSMAIVCDGVAGLKILDVHNPANVRQIGTVTGITPYDVILSGNLLIVTAESGFYLYDVSKLDKPVLYTKLM
ncbi:MAG: hypothetical protein ABIQ57_08155 [Candidatus Kapaibacterium sp.]